MTVEIRAARLAGYSDGFHGYRADPGDWTGSVRAAYSAAYEAGREDAKGGLWKLSLYPWKG